VRFGEEHPDQPPGADRALADEGDEYHFLFITKGGGSANRSDLYEETRAILNPGTLADFIENRFEKLSKAQANVVFVWMGLLTVRSWFQTRQ
jgi:tartrate dehydratase alpha subunit/fumarate hydratase class I-like protein